VIFSSFISPRASRGYEAAVLAPERADDDDFERFEEAIDEEPRFVFPVRTPDEGRLMNHPPGIDKINAVFA
jgi:hypothetical protein